MISPDLAVISRGARLKLGAYPVSASAALGAVPARFHRASTAGSAQARRQEIAAPMIERWQFQPTLPSEERSDGGPCKPACFRYLQASEREPAAERRPWRGSLAPRARKCAPAADLARTRTCEEVRHRQGFAQGLASAPASCAMAGSYQERPSDVERLTDAVVLGLVRIAFAQEVEAQAV